MTIGARALVAALAVTAALAVAPSASARPSAVDPTDGPDTLSIERLYRAALARDGDDAGLDYWHDQRDLGLPLTQIADWFATSPEFAGRTGGLDDDAFVADLYDTALGRTPDDGGFAHWTATLAAGASRGTVLLGFSDSAELKARSGLVGIRYRPPQRYLPRGGTRLFPDYRLVAEYGHPGIPALGVLGEEDAAHAAQQVQLRAVDYEQRGGTPVLTTFEIIATIAQSRAGDDGLYTYETPIEEIDPWLDALRTVHGYLLLDLQPGRARFIDQARVFESLLRQPDVGLALDPEWSVGPDQQPGHGTIGHTTAAEINEVSAYLADLVEAGGLPEKALVIHRFTAGMVVDPEDVVTRPGVAIVFHADGFGSRDAKLADYHDLLPDRFARGIKLFLDEDVDMFSPPEVLAFDPPPDVITYQ